jgi:molecular chaperone DnaK (HSP70)
MEEKEYYIGIDYGTSNSCIGIYMNSTVVIAPNTIGERTTPSLVAFTDKEIFAGEEILYQKIEGNNLIYEVKRFIGLDYDEFIERDFSKSLNYDVINQDGKPKIKVILKGKEQYYSAEEISAMILKKIVRSAEDFINEMEQGIKIAKAVITVPVHFTDKQKEAINAAARLADIEIERIINEPTAAALAYGLGISSKKAVKQQENEKLTNFGKSSYDVAPSEMMNLKVKKTLLFLIWEEEHLINQY